MYILYILYILYIPCDLYMLYVLYILYPLYCTVPYRTVPTGIRECEYIALAIIPSWPVPQGGHVLADVKNYHQKKNPHMFD